MHASALRYVQMRPPPPPPQAEAEPSAGRPDRPSSSNRRSRSRPTRQPAARAAADACRQRDDGCRAGDRHGRRHGHDGTAGAARNRRRRRLRRSARARDPATGPGTGGGAGQDYPPTVTNLVDPPDSRSVEGAAVSRSSPSSTSTRRASDAARASIRRRTATTTSGSRRCCMQMRVPARRSARDGTPVRDTAWITADRAITASSRVLGVSPSVWPCRLAQILCAAITCTDVAGSSVRVRRLLPSVTADRASEHCGR